MKKMLQILSIALVVIIAGCFDISEVAQPATAVNGTSIEASFLMKTYEADANPHHLIVGLLIPSAWTVDSVYYEGTVFGPDYCTFLHNDSLDRDLGGTIDLGWTDSLNVHYPPVAGMEWRVYQGTIGYASANADTVYTDVFIEMTLDGWAAGDFELGYFVSNAALDFGTAGYWDESLGYTMTVSNPVAIDAEGVMPSSMTLEQNFPNPFNPTTMIDFSIPTSGMVKMVVADLNGREVAVLHEGVLSAGNYSELWNGLNSNGSMVPSGMYIYRLESPEGVLVRKMMLLK
jgi:hypothetical protein